MIWSELGASMPGSGGSYIYLREGFGRETFGRLMGFLFIWQFILSGPLEIASGYIGFTQYLGYIWKDMGRPQSIAVIVALGVLNITLLYRRITFIGKLTISLWIGTILTTFAVIITGVHLISILPRFRLSTRVRSIFHSASFLVWARPRDRHLRLSWLLRYLLHRRRG
jgi:amino acid transporter